MQTTKNPESLQSPGFRVWINLEVVLALSQSLPDSMRVNFQNCPARTIWKFHSVVDTTVLSRQFANRNA